MNKLKKLKTENNPPKFCFQKRKSRIFFVKEKLVGFIFSKTKKEKNIVLKIGVILKRRIYSTLRNVSFLVIYLKK